jgi:hypothetical protein
MKNFACVFLILSFFTPISAQTEKTSAEKDTIFYGINNTYKFVTEDRAEMDCFELVQPFKAHDDDTGFKNQSACIRV